MQTWTVYDGLNPYADFDASGNPTMRYLYGLGVDELLARTDSSGRTLWYLTDVRGSVRALADVTQVLDEVVDTLEYDPFGNVISESAPSLGDRFKYTGREYDANTGLYDYRARWRDPKTGGFVSQDPLGLAAGDVNLYRYVGNSPTNFTDPFGLYAKDLDDGDRAEMAALGHCPPRKLRVVPDPQIDPDAVRKNQELLDADLTRIGGAAKVFTGYSLASAASALLAAPEPLASKFLGGLLFAYGTDVAASGFRDLYTGQPSETLASQGMQAALRPAVGADNARLLAVGTEMGVQIFAPLGVARHLNRVDPLRNMLPRTLAPRTARPQGARAPARPGALRVVEEAPAACKAPNNAPVGVHAPKGPPNPGGKLGKDATRAHIKEVADEMERRGYEITRGGGRRPEEYLPGPGGGRKGSSYPDITATKNGRTVRVNTIDTRADGVTPTTREANNAARIRRQTPGDHLILIPKPR